MYNIFHKLKSEKQQRIINAAFKEFEQSGFDKASTNKIVKVADISKGALFHYFRNKKDLYIYLIDYSIQIIEQLYDEIDFDEIDIFKRMEKIGLKKLHIQQKYPQVFDFLAAAMQEESKAVRDLIQQKMDPIYEEGTEKLYENIDYTKFREEIDVEKAINILTWTMYGFGGKGLRELNTFNNLGEFGEYYLQEWKQYTEILKYSFYK